MTTAERAAFYSLVGSVTSAIATLWFVGSVIADGVAWQGGVMLLVLAFAAKDKAYWTLANAQSERTGA